MGTPTPFTYTCSDCGGIVGPQGKNDLKKYVAIVAAAVAAIGLAGIVVGVLQAAPSSFLHLRQRLSTADYMAAYPDMDVSADHNYLAVTWVEGHDEYSGSKGHVYLRTASESSGWRDPIEVYHGDTNACAYDRAAVAITGTTAHIAYVVWDDCTTRDTTKIYYTTCPLTGGACSANEQVLSTTSKKVLWVDIAVDESGNPHLVYARYEGDPLTGKIFYRGHNGSSWESPVQVHGSGKNHTPAIAWSNGCAHIAWKEETGGFIYYQRYCGESGPTITIYGPSPDDPPHRPHIAAAPGGKVFIAWDRLAQDIPPPPTHFLLYKRSNNGGTSFLPDSREVGTDNIGTEFVPYTEEHVVGAADEWAYLKYLQPTVALNQDGWPAVAWHVGGDERGVYYTYAISGTDTTVDWVMTKTLLFAGEAGAPVVGFGDFITGTTPLLHVAYMDATGATWEVYYDSNEADVLDIPTVYLPLVMKGD
jgi:hypothetical protein